MSLRGMADYIPPPLRESAVVWWLRVIEIYGDKEWAKRRD